MGTNDAQLADILARLAAAERELVARRDRAPRRRGRAGRLAMVTLALLLALTPLSLLAANFADLNPGSAHNADINAITDAGISKGCTDTSHYCPNDLVTREQMASFLARTAGLGGNPPVTNAATLGGKRADGLVRVAQGTSAFQALEPPGVYFGVPTATGVYPDFIPMPGAVVTVEAPSDGFVLVNVVVGVNESADERGFIRMRDSTPGATPAVSRSASVLAYNAPVVDTLTLTWVFPVSGAGAKTFTLEVAQISAKGGDLAFHSDVLTALYVPFGYDGGTRLAP